MRFLRSLLVFGLASLAMIAPAAAATCNAVVDVALNVLYVGTTNIGVAPTFSLPGSAQAPQNFSAGTGSNQCDTIFADTRTLAASANETLDIFGALTDPLGATLNCAKVRAIKIAAKSTNTNSVIVGAAGSAVFLAGFGGTTPTWTIPPGGVFLVTAPAAGWAVTGATNDNLKIANSGAGTGITYDIVLVCGSV